MGVYKDLFVYCVFIEYLFEGFLRFFLYKFENRFFFLKKFIEFVLDIVRGMEYIYLWYIIYWDFKLENVLIDEDF